MGRLVKGWVEVWRELIGDSAEQSVILFLHILLAFLGHSSHGESLSYKYASLHSHSSHPSPPFRLSALALAVVNMVNKDAWLTMHLLIAWLFFLIFIRPFLRLHFEHMQPAAAKDKAESDFFLEYLSEKEVQSA